MLTRMPNNMYMCSMLSYAFFQFLYHLPDESSRMLIAIRVTEMHFLAYILNERVENRE